MKLRLLKCNVFALAALSSAIMILPACGDDNKSGNNSTTTEVDTTNTTISNTNVVPGPTDTTTRTGRRTGRITVNPEPMAKPATTSKDAQGYYNYTETQPAFGGGNQALQTYFENNMSYTQEAIDNGIEGTVMVNFTIDETGNARNAKVTGSKLGYGLDEEAVRVVNTMTSWKPGQIGGKNVKAWYTLPVTFRLE